MPPGSEVRQGPGGATYIVLPNITTGSDVYIEVLDAHARGWLEELDDLGRPIERAPSE